MILNRRIQLGLKKIIRKKKSVFGWPPAFRSVACCCASLTPTPTMHHFPKQSQHLLALLFVQRLSRTDVKLWPARPLWNHSEWWLVGITLLMSGSGYKSQDAFLVLSHIQVQTKLVCLVHCPLVWKIFSNKYCCSISMLDGEFLRYTFWPCCISQFDAPGLLSTGRHG